MSSPRIGRGMVALVAAYALALQALLLAFAPAMSQAADGVFAVLCSQAGEPGQTERPEHPCLVVCSAMGHGLSGVPVAVVAEALLPANVAIGVTPSAGWNAPRLATLGPQVPRGPPLL